MTTPTKKSQELDVRNIMQGLEEFANFMSFTGNHSNMRILSVETHDETELPTRPRSHLKSVTKSYRSSAF